MNRILILATALATLTTPAAALDPFADQFGIEWKTVGNWSIFVDENLGYGCFALISYPRTRSEGELAFRFGVDPFNDPAGDIMLAGEEWTSLDRGETYELQIQFDGRQPWRIQARGMFDNATVLFARVHDAFFAEVVASRQMMISYEGRKITSPLSLAGSAAAALEVARCQEVMLEATATAS